MAPSHSDGSGADTTSRNLRVVNITWWSVHWPGCASPVHCRFWCTWLCTFIYWRWCSFYEMLCWDICQCDVMIMKCIFSWRHFPHRHYCASSRSFDIRAGVKHVVVRYDDRKLLPPNTSIVSSEWYFSDFVCECCRFVCMTCRARSCVKVCSVCSSTQWIHFEAQVSKVHMHLQCSVCFLNLLCRISLIQFCA